MKTRLEVFTEIERLSNIRTRSGSLENIVIEAQIRALVWVLDGKIDAT